MNVKIVNISNKELPKYEVENSAGMDISADFTRVNETNPLKVNGDCNFTSNKILRLGPGSRALIPTGLRIAVPKGYEIQIRPRSGFALNNGITVLNSPGTIDCGYTDEIGIILLNTSASSVYIADGDRVAQMVLNKINTIEWEEVSDLETTSRKGGFGSTGK